ncbi:MAG TPA: LacI family DNA-binding transcriptional regulator [Agriterribacter sp.]|nr:LacI family DNA-binding transcriptional regulator [Agriterribacter sp.]
MNCFVKENYAVNFDSAMEKKVPTIKEIAKKLNISVSTVSRALHNHPSIGLRTKAQVQKLAKEMQYEPNQTAIQFKQGKTFTLGLILPNLREEFFSSAISGVEDTAFKGNYNVLIGQSHDELDREQKIVETMRKHRVDGVLVSISKQTTGIEHFEQLDNYNIPVVFFDRVPDVPNIHSVWCSLYYSTIEAVEFLFKKGHQRVAYIQGPLSLNIKNERLQGYYAAHKNKKIAVNDALIVTTDLSKESTEEAIEKLLSLKNPPTAILAFNDYVALDTIQYARNKKLKINKDISVVSYANWPIASYLDFPPIASVEQFPYEQGVRATELLFKLLNTRLPEGAMPYENIVLKSELIIR